MVAPKGLQGALNRLLGRMMAVGFVMGISALVASWTIGGPVLALLFGAEFAPHADVLVWMAVAAAISWTFVFLGTAINAMRMFWIQFPIQLCNLTVVTVAAYGLIDPHGLLGAAYALIAGALFVLVLNTLAVIWAHQQPPEAAAT